MDCVRYKDEERTDGREVMGFRIGLPSGLGSLGYEVSGKRPN